MKKYIMKYKREAFLNLFFSVAAGFLGVLATICIQFITRIVTNHETDRLYQIVWVILFALVIGVSIAAGVAYFSKSFNNKVMSSIRKDLFASIVRRDMTQFYQNNTSYYLSVYNNDLGVVEMNLVYRFYIWLEIAEITFSLGYAFMQSILVGVLVLIIGVSSSLLPILTKKLMKKANEDYMSELAVHNTVLNSCFSGFEVIKNYQMEKNIAVHYEKENVMLRRRKTRIDAIRAAMNQEGYWVIQCLQFAAMGLIGYMIMKGRMDVSILVVLGSMMNNISGSMYGALDAYAELNASSGICKKVLEEIEFEGIEAKNSETYQFSEKISLENVHFTYSNAEKEVLKGISLVFEKGKKYAIVGKSGCGKSTITKLLMRYYDTYSGKVEVDGRDFKEINETGFLENIAVIPQEVYIFEDTFRNNITLYGEFTDEEVMDAVEKAGLSGVLKKLENGFDTIMKESGKNVSGGERQRISIARAFLYHRKIFIMDEATSSLDNKTAYQIEKTIFDMPDVTVIMVTHHYNRDILGKCDKIYLINDGEVGEQGTFDKLMEQEGKFRLLYGRREE